MPSMNRVFLMGNLTRDPEMRQTQLGSVVTEMGLAVSSKYKNNAGEQVESVCFVEIVVWSRQAEVCNQFLSKGSPVLVEGRLQLDQWETKQGEKRSKLRVCANRVHFLWRPENTKAETAALHQENRSADQELVSETDDGTIPF